VSPKGGPRNLIYYGNDQRQLEYDFQVAPGADPTRIRLKFAGVDTLDIDSVRGVSGNVRIQLSRNGGATWTTLFSSTANDGVQNWTVSGPATTQARMQINSVATPSVADSSNGNFVIR
jgi:hypothetical protein